MGASLLALAKSIYYILNRPTNAHREGYVWNSKDGPFLRFFISSGGCKIFRKE